MSAFRPVTPTKIKVVENTTFMTPVSQVVRSNQVRCPDAPSRPLRPSMVTPVKNRDMNCPGAPYKPLRLSTVDTEVKNVIKPFVGPIRPNSNEEENLAFALLLIDE
jgi:hypothetical protein